MQSSEDLYLGWLSIRGLGLCGGQRQGGARDGRPGQQLSLVIGATYNLLSTSHASFLLAFSFSSSQAIYVVALVLEDAVAHPKDSIVSLESSAMTRHWFLRAPCTFSASVGKFCNQISGGTFLHVSSTSMTAYTFNHHQHRFHKFNHINSTSNAVVTPTHAIMQVIEAQDIQIATNSEVEVINPASPTNSGKFRAVALDLDGTLLRSDHAISDASVEYLRHLDAQGIQIIVATGRAGPTVMEHVAKLNLPRPLPVVCSNGARGLLCEPNGDGGVLSDEIFSMPVPLEVTRRALRLAKKLGQVVQYYHENDIYANPSMKHHYSLTDRYTFKTGSVVIHQPDSFSYLLAKNMLPCKLLVLCPKDELSSVFSAFRKEFSKSEVTLVYGDASAPQGFFHEISKLKTSNKDARGGWFIEILHPQVCKGKGLERMCEILGMSTHEVVAFGDGQNDLEFLQVAGRGVAMKNGKRLVKKVADEVTEYTNNKDGVIRTLQQMEKEGLLQARE